MIGLFVDQHLRGTEPLPAVGEVKVHDGKASLAWKAPARVIAAQMHYTTDTTEINKRNWTSTRASIDGRNAIAAAPPHNATAWFFTVQDDRGAVVSSRVMLREDNETVRVFIFAGQSNTARNSTD